MSAPWLGPLVGITDGADPPRVRAAVAAGLGTLLLRADRVPTTLLDLPCRLVLHTRAPEALALATELGLGLHLPGTGDVAAVRAAFRGPLGKSCHSVAEAHAVLRAGADWVFLSPIFPPTSKPGDRRPPLGPAALTGIGPVWALGGITPLRAEACRAAGAAGVVVMGGIFDTPDPAAAVAAWPPEWRSQYDQAVSS